MALVEFLEGSHVAFRSSLCQAVVGDWLCLGFGCGHVFVYLASDEGIVSLLLVSSRLSRFRRISRERYLFSRIPGAGRVREASTLDAGVMPRLERVVAFRQLKVTGFLQPHQYFATAHVQ